MRTWSDQNGLGDLLSGAFTPPPAKPMPRAVVDQNHAQLAQFLVSTLKVEDGDAEDATLTISAAEELSDQDFRLDPSVQEVIERPSRGKV